MKCWQCQTEIENLTGNGCIHIDRKSKSLKIYMDKRAYNYNDDKEMRKIKINEAEKIKIKNTDFELFQSDKLVFCSIMCYNENIKSL